MQLTLAFVVSALAVASSALAGDETRFAREVRHQRHHRHSKAHHHRNYSHSPGCSKGAHQHPSGGFSEVPGVSATSLLHAPSGAPAPTYTPARAPSSAAPTNNGQAQPSSSPAPGNSKPASGSDQQQWLDAHNQYRQEYTAPALTWNDELVPTAEKLVSACQFHHTGEGNPYGENIAAGYPDIKSVVDGWVNGPNEKSAFDPNTNGYSHFTQVVWAASRELGCASYTCPSIDGLPQANPVFTACEYSPPGNVIGEFKENVHAQKGGAPS